MSKIALHLSDTQLRALGYLSAAWSFLETEIDFTISAMGSLVNDDQSMPFPFNQRARYWRRPITAYYGENTTAAKQAKAIADKAEQIHENRYIALHGRVHGDPAGESDVIQIDSHRHLNGEWHFTFFEASSAQLDQISADILDLAAKLREFNENNLTARPAALPYRYE